MKLGKAFSYSLSIESRFQSRMGKSRKTAWWRGAGRGLILGTALLGVFFILLIRLLELTVVQGHRYRALADENRTRELIRHAPRGLLLDRTGKPLVINVPEYRLILPCERGRQATFGQECIRHVSEEEGIRLTGNGLSAGEFLEVDYLRRYPLGESTAHAVGYTGEIADRELTDEYYQLRKYRHGDHLGREGSEAVFEERLRGRDGKELVEVDAAGKIIRVLGRDDEVPGSNVTLALDADLSRVAASAFPAGARGAVVVSKPMTGEILVLYSSPSFDPNKFSLGMTQEEYEKLLDHQDRPIFNRAIGGVYPPGSTFKLVTAIAALEEGAITKQTTIEDTGVITIGPFSFGNWYFLKYGRTDGAVDIVKGLARSNDIFFYKTAEKLGIEKLHTWAEALGIGKPLGIELGGEAGGLMPDPQWKAQYFTSPADLESRNNQWYLGDTYHVAIGQGYLLTTPLQVNAWTNVVASGGKLCPPTVEKISGPAAGVHCKTIPIQKEITALISKGMRRACEPSGTAWPLFNFRVKRRSDEASGDNQSASGSAVPAARDALSVPIACKTGTAEFGDPQGKTHAWITMFAPMTAELAADGKVLPDVVTGEPEISVTVLIEEGGEGSSVAAPVAKTILTEWFER